MGPASRRRGTSPAIGAQGRGDGPGKPVNAAAALQITTVPARRRQARLLNCGFAAPNESATKGKPCAFRSATGTPGDFARSVSVAGVTRNYLLHVPASYRRDTPAPVVMLLHGGGGSAATIGAATGGFSALADRNGFIAVYPDSVAGT